MSEPLNREQILEAQKHKGQIQTPSRLAPLFEKPDLLKNIWKALDRDHREDHKEKLAVFIIGVSAELPDEADHCSVALKGDSSAGKDNVIKTVFKHFPKEDNFFLTSATKSALEENGNEAKRIAFSEINKHREGGANNDIVESFKQLAEGGMDSMKQDVNTGYRTTKRSKVGQKSLFYGTTEVESDEELETRYVVIPIRSDAKKNKIVVDDSLKKAGDFDFYVDKQKEYSWIASSIKALDKELQPIIPFAHLLTEEIQDEDKKASFFDYTKERVKRDAKRLLSLTRAITWLHQKQRCIKDYRGKKFVISEPCDFITAVQLFAGFFNLTYTGLDYRIEKTLNKIRELEGKHDGEIMKMNFPSKYNGYVVRHKLQEDLGVASQTTIKKYLSKLMDLGYLKDTHYDQTVNPKAYLIKSSGYQMGINRVSLPISVTAINTHLTAWMTPEIITKSYWDREISTINLDFLENHSISAKNETLKNETLISPENTETEKTIKNHNDLLAVLRKALPKPVSYEELRKLCHFENPDQWLELTLKTLARRGDVFEHKPGEWVVLE